MKVDVRATNGRNVTVNLDNYAELTPRSAIAAVEIAFGTLARADVSARIGGEFKQYRVTGIGRERRARRTY